MALHCLRAGYLPMTVFNRTRDKARPLEEAGATLVSSPQEVADASDVVLTMVGYPEDVEEVILSTDKGIIHRMQPGSHIVDLTTSSPSLARRISECAKSRHICAFDAPVTGGDIGARDGTLRTLVGGDGGVEAFRVIEPLLQCFSSSVTYLGPASAGQHCKMANQITIATTMVGMCEGLLYAHRAGLSLDAYLVAISEGAAASFSLRAYAPRILNRDMEPGFRVDHFVKDLGIALGECQALQLSLPGLALAQQLYIALQANEGGRLGTQALIIALERLNNTSLESHQGSS